MTAPVGAESSASLPRATLSRLRHELVTPVHQIFGYADLLDETLAEPGVLDIGVLRADLARIRDAGQRLLSLVDRYTQQPSGPASESPMILSHLETPPAGHASVPPVGSSSASGDALTGTLLVADDDPDNRAVLARYLTQRGHKVVTAVDGEEALRLLREQSFDLLLLDLVMPGPDGLAVLQRIRADDQLRPVPVIMISALSELPNVVRCIELGAEDYLPKPVSPVLLRARIGAALEKKRLRDREQRLFAELSQNYQRLQELERLRDDTTSMLVHDLRTPLSALMTGLQALPLVGELDPRQQRLLRLSLRGGQTLLGLINDLLDIGRLQDGSLVLERRSLDAPALREVLEQAMGQVAPLAEEKRLTFTLEAEPPWPLLSADADLLRRVLVNLLANAVKFTTTPGSVTLRTAVDDGALRFLVSDTGCGIPKEAQERIFDKFATVARDSKGQSSGLGLAFCRMAVAAHGGQIGVESVVGQGSTFFFTLPTSDPRP